MKIKEKCHVCGREMPECRLVFKGIELRGWRCRCGEELIPSSEVVRYEVLTGKRKSDVRKVTAMGNSLVVSIPRQYTQELGIKKGSRLLVMREKKFLKLLPVTV